eukprot:TRINITY_DN66268_c0_g1_i1.p1 TRINITY_DN66268_c0_g1~~TRINITY_DN66268_c0_g1_i1.p1  ORF type:complete len:806 (+),score=149.99 TRINITY_DN66268_c0_g1_i1:87-2420(+)
MMAGAGSALFYNWLSDNFSYNRDAWMADIAVMQAHGFQKDNMDVAVHAMCRDAIRDRQTSISTQLGNNLLSTTLFLAMAMDVYVSGVLPDRTADFVLNLYMITLGSSVIWLLLSIGAAVACIMVMYTSSSQILTANMEMLWQRLDDKMSNYGELLTANFEHRTIKELFTPPMAKMVKKRSKDLMRGTRAASWVARICERVESRERPDSRRSSSGPEGEAVPDGDEDQIKPEAADADHFREIVLAYRDEWIDRERVWLPMQSHSRLFALLGMKALLDAWGYFTLAKYYGVQSAGWEMWFGQTVFIFLAVSMIPLLLSLSIEAKFQLHTAVGMGWGPLSALVGATSCHTWVVRIFVPLSFAFHFWTNLQGLILYGGPRRQIEEQADEHITSIKRRRSSRSSASSGNLAEEQDSPGLPEQAPDWSASKRSISAVLGVSYDSPDDRDAQLTQSRIYNANILFAARFFITSLWFIGVCWSVCMMYGSDALPLCPLTGAKLQNTVLPSPHFQPSSITGGEEGVEHVASKHDRLYSAANDATAFIQVALQVQNMTTPGAAAAAESASHGRRLFMADRFQIFEFVDNYSTPRSVDCEVNSTIADIALGCSQDGPCLLRALLHASPPIVVNCATGQEEKLLRSPEAPAVRFTALNRDTIVVAHGNELVRYEWSQKHAAWSPTWSVVDAALLHMNSTSPDLSAARDLIAVAAGETLQVFNFSTGHQCGRWKLPPGTIAIDLQGSAELLALSHKPDTPLLRVDLGKHSSCQFPSQQSSRALKEAFVLD